MKLASSATLLIALFAAPVCADELRALKAHVHGHGTLDMAVEGSEVALMLEAPGMDILGFEHAARGKDEQAAIVQARRALSDPLALFKIPPSAGCKVTDAKVVLGAEQEHGEGGHDHEAKDEGAHANGHDKHDHHGHNDVRATYALECAKPAAITSLAFDYFKTFLGAERLTVNVVTAKAQNSFEVTRDKPTLDLGGMM